MILYMEKEHQELLKPANKGVEFVPGQDFVGPVPQPRTGKGGFVVVPKSEGGGIRWNPDFDQSSIYTQTSLPPSQSLPPSPEQIVGTNSYRKTTCSIRART